MWLATTIGFFKRHNLLKNAMWQLVIVTGISILWDYLTGWRGWSVDFVLPIVSMGILLAMVVISAIRRYPAKEYMIYLVMAAGYGLVVPLLLLVFGAVAAGMAESDRNRSLLPVPDRDRAVQMERIPGRDA